jgi:hypothetical protein
MRFHRLFGSCDPEKHITAAAKMYVVETYSHYLISFWNADCI